MLELEHEFRVVDIYSRLTPDDATVARGRSITSDRLEREMRQAGITRSIVFPRSKGETDYVAANNGVARRSIDRPFAAFARIHGSQNGTTSRAGRLRNVVSRRQENYTTPEDVEQYAYDERFHGFVLDPSVDGYPDEDLLAVLEEVRLPIIVDGQTAPSDLAESLLGRAIPTIVSHFGGHPLRRERMSEMIDLLGVYDECYVETSFVRYRDQLERALLEHPDRVLFGSGAPDCHPGVGVMEILTLDVSGDKLRRVFSKNACRIIDGARPHP